MTKASVWVVQRPQQLVVLIHAADRRVAVAQLRGPGGPQPNLLEAHRALDGRMGRMDGLSSCECTGLFSTLNHVAYPVSMN